MKKKAQRKMEKEKSEERVGKKGQKKRKGADR